MDSPPKRLTRARAAAKASDLVKSTKIVTAAAKARGPSTATAGTQSTTAKRKMRADEVGRNPAEGEASVTRTLRGRPRKNKLAEVNPTPVPVPAPARTSRGRPVRQAGAELATALEPTTTTRARGRPRQLSTKETEDPSRRPTRPSNMAASSLKVGSTIATRPSVKKTVTFQEPDKENLEMRQEKKPPIAQGLRTRPTRCTTRATASRGNKSVERPKSAVEKKEPLSPKKITQMPVSRIADSSEDELAATKPPSPISFMKKSPIKLSTTASVAALVKKNEASTMGIDAGQLVAEQMDDAVLHAHSLKSPPKKLPPSPTKDFLKSLAKKVGAIPLLVSPMEAATSIAEQSGRSSSEDKTLLLSAAKRPVSPKRGIDFQSISATNMSKTPKTVFKSTMFQTPARKAGPSFKTWTDPRRRETAERPDLRVFRPLLLQTPSRAPSREPQSLRQPQQMHTEETPIFERDSLSKGTEFLESTFPGRLSAVLPRHIDPAFDEIPSSTAHPKGELVNIGDQSPISAIAMDHGEGGMAESILSHPCAQPSSPAARAETDYVGIVGCSTQVSESPKEPLSSLENPIYQLRAKDSSVYLEFHDESASEDEEMESRFAHVNQSPERPSRSTLDSRQDTLGLNSLAEQLSSWSASSPRKDSKAKIAVVTHSENERHILEESDVESTMGSHFDENIRVRADEQANEVQARLEAETDGELDEPILEEIPITEEDVALAQEADDLSAMELGKVEELTGSFSLSDCLSEPSQDYGDENEMPKTETLTHSHQTQPPETPARPTQIGWYATTTKVPLKPADESTPSPLKRRGYSVPRTLSGISIETTGNTFASPLAEAQSSSSSTTSSKGNGLAAVRTPSLLKESRQLTPLATITPTQTPRREAGAGLLRGAVVYVDVRTTDGTDASNIFVELLGQMGASCVDAWDWKSEMCDEGHSHPFMANVTHVVFKDGDRSLLEKVQRMRHGVHCVGVNWVLDCERENKWLDEAPYIMTMQRLSTCDGSRRQSTSIGESRLRTETSKDLQAAYTPVRRRESTAWQWTPSDSDEQESGQWPQMLLTPVPKTPAPEAVAAYAAEIHETPEEAATSRDTASPTQQSLIMRTCPPGARHFDVGHGGGEMMFERNSDEEVLQRLMTARRKSLQFAPKIGSPLARSWA